MSFSFSKLKSLLPSRNETNNSKLNRRNLINEKLEPEIGFKLILDPGYQPESSSVPVLNLHIISARHLQTTFGLKIVEGFQIKVKLFPGSVRYESTIQTTSCPKFNETFKFQMAPTLKSSIRSRSKDDLLARSLPEKLFKGNFVVITVFALLELPPGAVNSIKERYQSIKRKGSILLKEGRVGLTDTNDKDKEKEKGKPKEKDKEKVKDKDKNTVNLTRSETQRNIGSVTYFLDPKKFTENPKTGHFCTEEQWQLIKDITVSSSSTANSSYTSSITTSLKGQVEVILQICDPEPEPDDEEIDIVQLNSSEPSSSSKIDEQQNNSTKTRWSIGNMKTKIKGNNKKDKNVKGSCLKITTSKMRCSIKVKEEFENIAGEEIYLKTTVFERGILSASWKSKTFSPSLSTRWDPDDSTIIIPLVNDYDVDYVTVKISIATKTKVGKKIYLGTLSLGESTTGTRLEHWDEMISSKGQSIAKWHSFE